MSSEAVATSRIRNWETVRGLAELQILRRASYLMLIFIPLLAGLWPGARAVLNRYNSAVESAHVALENTIDRLQNLVVRTEAPDASTSSIASSLQQLELRLDELRTEYAMRPVQSTELPSVWVLTFLGSLLVVAGQTIYQIRAPELVRRTTRQQYASDRRRQYAEHASEGIIEHGQALVAATDPSDFPRWMAAPSLPRLRQRRDEWAQDRGITINAQLKKTLDTDQVDAANAKSESQQERWRLDVAEAGAHGEYMKSSVADCPVFAAPFPGCGGDPTDDPLDCGFYICP